MRTRWVIAIAVASALIAGSAGAIGVAYFGDVKGDQGPAGERGPTGPLGPPGPRGPQGDTNTFDLEVTVDDLASGLDDLDGRVSDLEFTADTSDTFTLERDVSDLQSTVSSICIELGLGC